MWCFFPLKFDFPKIEEKHPQNNEKENQKTKTNP
jgi:hypothetical protein